ncbi:hypothetical protein OAD66_06630 [Bacteroidia bacterium]|nr:hypothetical protein [Bacteroidia bacterium]
MDNPKKFLSDDIPAFFYKFDTEVPFTNCSLCDGKLSDYSKYAIEKVFKQNKILNTSEIVYEYAICWDCAQTSGSDISEDSKIAIMSLFVEHKNFISMRTDYLHANKMYNIESWIERCSLTGKEVRLCNEYAISAIIENDKLLYEHSPMVVSDEFMEKLQSVLSKETKDKFDGLRDKILDGSPSVEDLIFSPTPGVL